MTLHCIMVTITLQDVLQVPLLTKLCPLHWTHCTILSITLNSMFQPCFLVVQQATIMHWCSIPQTQSGLAQFSSSIQVNLPTQLPLDHFYSPCRTSFGFIVSRKPLLKSLPIPGKCSLSVFTHACLYLNTKSHYLPSLNKSFLEGNNKVYYLCIQSPKKVCDIEQVLNKSLLNELVSTPCEHSSQQNTNLTKHTFSIFSLSRCLQYRSICDVCVHLKYEGILICMYIYTSGSHIMPCFGNSCIIFPLGEQFL